MLGITSTDPKVLRKLAKHPDRFIRARAASNKHTPVETLKMLGADSDPGVRASIALNVKTPSGFLARMFTRGLGDGDLADLVFCALANNPHTPSMFLEHLFVQCPAWGVRAGLVGNPSTPQKVLKKLSELHKEKTERLEDVNKEIREAAKMRLRRIG